MSLHLFVERRASAAIRDPFRDAEIGFVDCSEAVVTGIRRRGSPRCIMNSLCAGACCVRRLSVVRMDENPFV